MEAVAKRLNFVGDPEEFEVDVPEEHPSSSSNSSSSLNGKKDQRIQVFLRIKPSSCKKEEETILVVDEARVRTKAPPESASSKSGSIGSEFSFSKVWGTETSQQTVFDSLKPMVDNVLEGNGKDGLIFCYGVTNSGKTYTIEGNNKEPGILPRVFELIFNVHKIAEIRMGYLQIYNDNIYDLQEPPLPAGDADGLIKKSLKLKLREEEILVEGLKEVKIKNIKEAMDVLAKGKSNRITMDNNINGSSSRSHTVCVISYNNSKLHIVDLAGSERGKRTKASGARQMEASQINLSLSQLMMCLDAIRYNQKLGRLYPDKPRNAAPFRPVPFRGSKLTLLFRDCLKGKNAGSVVMIVNASHDPNDYDETIQALRYGEQNKNVIIESTALPEKKKPDAEEEDEAGLAKLRRELSEAKARMAVMEIEIREEIAREMGDQLSEMEARYKSRMEQVNGLGEEQFNRLLLSTKKKKNEEEISFSYNKEDVRALVQQIEECEEEMARMRETHLREVAAMRNEINNLKRHQIEKEKEARKEPSVIRATLTTPQQVAEERRKGDRLMRDLEEERRVAQGVLRERDELQGFVDRAVVQQRESNERESELLREIQRLKEEMEVLRGRLLNEEKNVYALKLKLNPTASPTKRKSDRLPDLANEKHFKEEGRKENNLNIYNLR